MTRDLTIGAGDTELYLVAGMLAAGAISIRVFLLREAGKANKPTGIRQPPALTLDLPCEGFRP